MNDKFSESLQAEKNLRHQQRTNVDGDTTCGWERKKDVNLDIFYKSACGMIVYLPFVELTLIENEFFYCPKCGCEIRESEVEK